MNDLPAAAITDDEELLVEPGLGKRLSAHQRWIGISTGLAIVLLIAGVLVAIWGLFRFENSPQDLDQLGGFLAGTTGALWSAAGLFLIFAAFVGQQRQSAYQEEDIRLNRIELRQTQVELRGQKEQLTEQTRTFRQQRFESTFFQLLSLHHQIVNGIDRVEKSFSWSAGINKAASEKSPEEFRGRDVFVRIYQELRSAYKDFAVENGPANLEETVTDVYRRVYRRNQSDLGHYFRNLYTLVKFVRNSDIEDKTTYTNIVRAQLSTHELLLLFYNCLSEHGREKFKPLVEQFHLLKNMPKEMLLAAEHRDAYADAAFGGNDSLSAEMLGDPQASR